MKLVVLHHHFQPGGVTNVVRTHLQGIADLPQPDRPHSVLLIGGRDLGDAPLPFAPPPQLVVTHALCRPLDYAPPTPPAAIPAATDGDGLARAVARLLRQACCDPADTVLHWHNPTLGKNAAVCGAIGRLAADGWRMLLQIHDFAEDFRPHNYAYLIAALGADNPRELESQLYPQAATIHYATLTSSDRQHLRRVGVSDDRAHVVANTVAPATEQGGADETAAAAAARRALDLPSMARLFLYPVRGIRRKNLGELLLLALLTPPEAWMAVTLPPTTPVERHSYERWRDLAQRLRLPVRFDAGLHPHIGLADHLAAAEAVVSTSVAEGFGLVFLEPWLAGRSLIARDLPHVTDDLQRSGLRFPARYASLPVPMDAAECAAAQAEIDAAWQAAWQLLPPAFGKSLQRAPSAAAGELDFAMLTPARQQAVLRQLADDHSYADAMRQRCAAVLGWFDQPRDSQHALIDDNRRTVRHAYCPMDQARRLRSIYDRLLEAPPAQRVEPPTAAGDLWPHFVSRDRFCPCRTETFGDTTTRPPVSADV